MSPVKPSSTAARLLVSGAVAAAYAAVAVAAGAATPAVGVFGLLNTVFGGVIGDDLGDRWRKRALAPDHDHVNNDLARLVGDAIARVLYDLHDDRDQPAPVRRWAARVAERASANFVALPLTDDLGDLVPTRLPDLFAAAADPTAPPPADPAALAGLLDVLRVAASVEPHPAAAAAAVDRLHARLTHAIREMFKRDFSGDGRAYTALCIDANANVRTAIAALARDQRELLGRQGVQADALRDLRRTLDERLDHHQACNAELLAGMSGLSADVADARRTLDQVLVQQWGIAATVELVRRETAALRDDSATTHRLLDLIVHGLDDVMREARAIQARSTDGAAVRREDLPAATIARAERLLAAYEQERRAVAASAAGRHTDADRLIQPLLADSTAETVRLLLLDGDNRYAARQYDLAVDPYEKALALQRDSWDAMNWAANAHARAGGGSVPDHRRRALSLYDQAIAASRDAAPDRWAVFQVNRGLTLARLATGDRTANLRQALAAYDLALTRLSPWWCPTEWAWAMSCAGDAWRDLPGGDRVDHHRRAMAAYDAALSVYTPDDHPAGWATVQYSLGLAWRVAPGADPALATSEALAALDRAASVFTRATDPCMWASLQVDAAAVLLDRPASTPADRAADATRALNACLTAVDVFAAHGGPSDAAWANWHLGTALLSLPDGDRADHVRRAIEAFTASVGGYVADADPGSWAAIHRQLGLAWVALPVGRWADNIGRALEAFAAGLAAPGLREADPLAWAGLHYYHGRARTANGRDETEPLADARAAAAAVLATNVQAALAVYTPGDHPKLWADVKCLELTARLAAADPGRANDMTAAIAAGEAALTVLSPAEAPWQWAAVQTALSNAWRRHASWDRTDHLRRAWTAADAALAVHTREAAPYAWARARAEHGHARMILAELTTDPATRAPHVSAALAAYADVLSLGPPWQAVPTDAVGDPGPDPFAWTWSQIGVARAHVRFPAADRQQSWARAAEAFEAALPLFHRYAPAFPWAQAQFEYAQVLSQPTTGNDLNLDRLARAVEAHEAALTVWTRESHPAGWATVQRLLAPVLHQLADRRPAYRDRAILAAEAVLAATSRADQPREWAGLQTGLSALLVNATSGDLADQCRRGAAAAEAAMSVDTADVHPAGWAAARSNYGLALARLALHRPPAEAMELYHQAVAAFDDALAVLTPAAHQANWAITSFNLAQTLLTLAGQEADRPAPVAEADGRRAEADGRRAEAAAAAAVPHLTAIGRPDMAATAQVIVFILIADRVETSEAAHPTDVIEAVSAGRAALAADVPGMTAAGRAMLALQLATSLARLADLPGQPSLDLRAEARRWADDAAAAHDADTPPAESAILADVLVRCDPALTGNATVTGTTP